MAQLLHLWKPVKSRLQLGRDRLRRYIGRLLFDRAKASSTRMDVQTVLLVRWDAKLGDAFVSSWIFRELKKQYPAIRISVITTPAMAWLFRDHFGADTVYETSKRPGYLTLYRLARKIGHTNLLVHFGQHLKLKDLFFLRLIKSDHIAGLDDDISLVDIKLGKTTKNLHFREKFRTLSALLGVSSPDMTYIIPSLPACEANIESFWPKNRPIICFNPYGSGGSRRLRAESIEKILSFLALTFPDIACCLLYAPDDRKEVEELGSKYPSTVIYYKHSTHIGDVIAQMRRSLAVLSVDTSTVHIANGLAKPLFAIYNEGPKNFTEWGPNDSSDQTIFAAASYPPDINLISFEQFEQEFVPWFSAIFTSSLRCV